MKPRNVLPAFFFVALLLVGGVSTGLVGISYPLAVDDTTLKSPVEVIRIDGDKIELADGRVIILYVGAPVDDGLRKRISHSRNRVEVEHRPGDPMVGVFVDERTSFCGTPWARLITIPIIPDRIPGNRRTFICLGEVTSAPGPSPAAPSAPASGSSPAGGGPRQH